VISDVQVGDVEVSAHNLPIAVGELFTLTLRTHPLCQQYRHTPLPLKQWYLPRILTNLGLIADQALSGDQSVTAAFSTVLASADSIVSSSHPPFKRVTRLLMVM